MNGAKNEVEIGGGVHGNRDRSAKKNRPEGSQPFGGVWSPEEHAIARADVVGGKNVTGSECGSGEFRICLRLPTVAEDLHDSGFGAVFAKIVEKRNEVVASHFKEIRPS